MRFFFALLISFITAFSASATQWLKLDDKTYLIAPHSSARYLTSNQAILLGKQCAAIIDAHGDFTALESFLEQVSKRISQPICHLISTSSDTEQILGMMLLAHALPNARWHAPNYVFNNFAHYENALAEKLSRFEQSLQLSQARFASAQNEELQQRLDTAKQRIEKWQVAKLARPSTLLNERANFDLGEHLITISTHHGATGADLAVFSHANSGLFAGLTVNPIPYVQNTDLAPWLSLLEQFSSAKNIAWFLPAQGKPYKNAALLKPMRFLKSVMESDTKTLPAELNKLYKNDEITQTRLRLMFELAKTKQAQKMQKQGTVL